MKESIKDLHPQTESIIPQIQSILASINDKVGKIHSHTRTLKSFNTKLEILLECLNAYSFVDPSRESIQSVNSQSVIKEETTKKIRIEGKCDSLEEKIVKVFDKAIQSVALALFEYIKSRETVTLDDLVKSIKYSKYKTIEIVNVLIKEKIIVKSFEKGFVYRVNQQQ